MISDPFLLEKKRQKLASKKKLNQLKKLYRASLPEVFNINTSSFWNIRQSETIKIASQDGMTQDRIEIVFGMLPSDARVILDVGAGYGFIEEKLKDKEVKLYGIDISTEAIRILRKRFRGEFKKMNVFSMSYDSDQFDAVFMLEVLEHIPPSKTFMVLKKIYKILKKDGVLLLSVPTNEGLEEMGNNPNGHVRMYTEDLIRAELELAGFRVDTLHKLYAFKEMYKIKKIISKFLRVKWQPNDLVIMSQKI